MPSGNSARAPVPFTGLEVDTESWRNQLLNVHEKHLSKSIATPARSQCVNSLWPSDAIWRHRTWSPLFQLYDLLTVPSHYPNHCWLTTSKVLCHLLGFEDYQFKTTAKGQWVKTTCLLVLDRWVWLNYRRGAFTSKWHALTKYTVPDNTRGHVATAPRQATCWLRLLHCTLDISRSLFFKDLTKDTP